MLLFSCFVLLTNSLKMQFAPRSKYTFKITGQGLFVAVNYEDFNGYAGVGTNMYPIFGNGYKAIYFSTQGGFVEIHNRLGQEMTLYYDIFYGQCDYLDITISPSPIGRYITDDTNYASNKCNIWAGSSFYILNIFISSPENYMQSGKLIANFPSIGYRYNCTHTSFSKTLGKLKSPLTIEINDIEPDYPRIVVDSKKIQKSEVLCLDKNGLTQCKFKSFDEISPDDNNDDDDGGFSKVITITIISIGVVVFILFGICICCNNK